MTLSDPNPNFKVTVYFKGEYLANGASNRDRSISSSSLVLDGDGALGGSNGSIFGSMIDQIQTRVGWGNMVCSSFTHQYLENGTRYDQ